MPDNGTTVAGKRLLTIPNLITGVRIAIAPITVWAIVRAADSAEALDWTWHWITLGLLILAEVSDIADGQVARRIGGESTIGKILDPFSDSLFRMLVFLSFLSVGWMPLWMAAVFFSRDILVAYLRVFSALNDVVLSARVSGKIKAISQGTAQIGTVVAFLLAQSDFVSGYLESGFPAVPVIWFLCAQAAAVTAWSALDYSVSVAKQYRTSVTG